MSSGARKIEFKSSFHVVAGVFLIVLLVIRPLYLAYGEHGVLREQKVVVKESKFARSRLRNVHGESNAKCNLFEGRWIYDEKSPPLYKERECSFMTADFACEKYRRKDFKYQNWRWQPRHCNLPRFNGAAFLKKIRGKKLIFVGDSLNRNQWVSMLCLIDSSLPPSSFKSIIRTGSNLFSFEAKEYNATIGFYWSPFLVETNSDDPIVHRPTEIIIRIKAIEKHAKYWTDADILIFDSYLWWLEPTKTLLWGSFGSSNAIYKKVGMRERIYEMGLNTWSEWLEININRTKTKLFFMSIAPNHEWVEGWNREESCYATTEPISDERYWGVTANRSMMEVAESAIRNLEARGLKIEYLNITQMSGYRKDGHPSIHRQFYHNITQEQLKDPISYSDCVHWCLPGVPDTWNQIVYAYLIMT